MLIARQKRPIHGTRNESCIGHKKGYNLMFNSKYHDYVGMRNQIENAVRRRARVTPR